MKKMKTVITASFITALLIAPTSANAIYSVQDSGSSAFDWVKNEEKYVNIDNKYKELFFFSGSQFSDEQLNNTVLYSNIYGTGVHAFVPVDLMGKSGNDLTAVFNLTEGTTEEQVNEVLGEKFNEYFKITRYDHNPDYLYQFSSPRRNFKEVCKILKEENLIDSFVIPSGYMQHISFGMEVDSENALGYWLTDDEYEALNNYVTENEIGELELREAGNTHSKYQLIINEMNSCEDKFEVALNIYNETGFGISSISPTVVPQIEATNFVDVIDVFNAINGDTNNDGELTVADAAAILQYLGNAEKFPISAQGKFNADISGDGITAADALAVQRMVLQSANK